MKIIEKIKNKYNWWKKGYCTKHGIEKKEHGYDGDKSCEKCLQEMYDWFDRHYK